MYESIQALKNYQIYNKNDALKIIKYAYLVKMTLEYAQFLL